MLVEGTSPVNGLIDRMALTLVLTPDQAKKVAEGAKKVRPAYHDPDARVTREISEDMEAVLILTPAGNRQQAVQYMRGDQTTMMEQANQRDACLLAALQVDLEVANQQVTELAQQAGKIAKIQQAITQNPQFQSVAEVGPFARALQLGTDEQVHQYDQAKHRQVVATVMAARVQAGGLTADQDEARKSWANVVSEYVGD